MSRFLGAVPSLPVADTARAAAFYTAVLGFEQVRDLGGEPLGIFRKDAVELHVWEADGSAKGAEMHLQGSASCRIEVDDVLAVHERCARAGVVHPNGALQDRPWGTTEFAVLDPDGNLVTFYARRD